MPIIHQIGDLLESDCDYICHQVNCQGKMNSGIAKSIREKWPIVYREYAMKYFNSLPELLLGDIQLVNINMSEADGQEQFIINMFAQQYYGYDGRRYTSYDAFWNCLNLIKQTVPKGCKIGFPGYIGCVRGGANWNVIYEMISEVLGEDYDVYIYFLEARNDEGSIWPY